MKAEEIITSGLLEAYALGACTPEEITQVEAALNDPRVKHELSLIEEAVWKLAKAAEKSVPAELKTKLDQNLFGAEQQTEAKLVSMAPTPSDSGSWPILKYAAGIALLMSVGGNLYQFSSNQNLQEQLSALTESNTVLAGEIKVVRQDLDFYGQVADFFQRGEIKSIELAEVNKSKGRALLYCDMKTGKVAVKPMELPAIDQQHQYQLWAIVDGKPVDMGMIPNDMVGKDQLAMLKTISGAQAFAITKEPFGGKPEPTLSEMVVMAKAS